MVYNQDDEKTEFFSNAGRKAILSGIGLKITKMLKQVDWVLVLIVLFLVCFGLVAIASCTSLTSGVELSFWDFVDSLNYEYAKPQLVYFGVGVLLAVILMCIDYNHLRDYSNLIYWGSVVMLLLVLIFGKEINGTTGWFKIGNRSFQPAEVSKVTIIIVLAKEFAQYTEGRSNGIQTFRELFPLLWRLAIPLVLIFLQPDWGTAFVYVFTFAGMMFMAKTSLKLIGWMALGVGIVVPCSWLFMADYQKERIRVFFNPEHDVQGSGHNVARAKEVIQQGGMNGKGLFGDGLLTPGGYVPEKQTDFIFSATGEAVGFWGCLLLIAVYLLLLWRMIMLALRAKDDFGSYMILGVVFMFLFHIFENIGMNIGVMPVTGIPLPLFSYGGSNMLTSIAAIGLVLNVNMRRMRYSV